MDPRPIIPALARTRSRPPSRPPTPQRADAELDMDENSALISPTPASRALRHRRVASNSEPGLAYQLLRGAGGTPRLGFRAFLLERKKRCAFLAAITLANLTLFLLVVDYTFSEFLFRKHRDLTLTRLGVIGPSSANIFLRSPKHTAVRVEYRRDSPNSDTWLPGPAVSTSEETDFTASVAVDGLEPGTRYKYRWVGADGARVFSSVEEEHLGFKTAPAVGSKGKFTFAYTSCVKPDFPYGVKGVRGFYEISKVRDLSFVLFLGDLVYAGPFASPYLLLDCSLKGRRLD
ncbi:PhoD-like phosphatase-domain-containing protein [Blyttiomyces helicus]|uniref:PhoD-like phosphatase-domain-containing protein n=1 Tax=Blyttiomyces helicus TaxID=388810 RepID=A0A4P9VX34_9FUNG|nr:PhoD-like phosphatase-domain-containing protein [Blyttiomyces helicus]|eukprot:RKO83435.1 PhoD-like phosphatase-domain-containing protein [Blyttiomyces helicus]